MWEQPLWLHAVSHAIYCFCWNSVISEIFYKIAQSLGSMAFRIYEVCTCAVRKRHGLPTVNIIGKVFSSIISYNFFIPLYSSVALMLLCNTCLTEPQESWLNLTLLLLLLACTCAVDQQPQWLVFFKFMTVNLKWALFVLPPCPSLLSQTVLFFNGIIFNYYYNFYWYH